MIGNRRCGVDEWEQPSFYRYQMYPTAKSGDGNEMGADMWQGGRGKKTPYRIVH